MGGGGGTDMLQSGDWDSHLQQMFLVCVFNVSEDQPYTILQAPSSSTAQDIITQVIAPYYKTQASGCSTAQDIIIKVIATHHITVPEL